MKMNNKQTIIIVVITSLLLGVGVILTACKSKKKKSTEEEIDNTNYISAPQGVVLKTPTLAMSFVKTPTFTVQGVEPGDTVSLYMDAHCRAVGLLGSHVVAAEQTEVDITIDPLTDPGAYAIFAKRTNAQGASRCSAQLNTYQLVGCPNEFYVPVEGNVELGTSAFCAMKTEAKKDENNMAVSKYEGIPWHTITAADAKLACRQIPIEHGYCNLISNPQWMTMARDIEATSANWSTGVVGSGFLNRGHSNYHPDTPIEIDDPEFPYDEWGETFVFKRTHVLSNGAVIWDLSGDPAEIVDWETGGNVFTVGPLTCPAEVSELKDVNCPALQPNDYMPGNPAGIAANSYTAEQYNLGKFYGTAEENRTPELGGVALRGGDWTQGKKAGIFRLDLNRGTSYSSYWATFRCGCVVTGDHHNYQGLAVPTAVTLKNPKRMPSFSKTPTFTVSGVESGDTVRLFSDGSCHSKYQLGSAIVPSGKTQVDITSSTLPVLGDYYIYAQRTSAAGESSPCSAQMMTYHLIGCPDESYVPVPGDETLDTTDFCVMMTEAKAKVAKYDGNPTVWNPTSSAKTRCRQISFPYTKCNLISNAQWMTIARNIESTAANWSGGEVGSGAINQGHSDGSPNKHLSIVDPTDPWDQTDPDGLETPWSQKRTHILNNGSVIWDFAGNDAEWVDWETDTDTYTVWPTSCPAGTYELYDAVCPDLTANDYLPLNPAGILTSEYTSSAYGLGRFLGTSDSVRNGGTGVGGMRGGYYSDANAGIFNLDLTHPNGSDYGHVGYRCVCATSGE